MLKHSQKLILLLSLAAPLSTFAGPQHVSSELDLSMLDRNGAPFRTFHLGLYQEGLDAHRPAAVMSMPSDTLADMPITALLDAEEVTGVTRQSNVTLPSRPDIAPLLVHRYDDQAVHAGPIR